MPARGNNEQIQQKHRTNVAEKEQCQENYTPEICENNAYIGAERGWKSCKCGENEGKQIFIINICSKVKEDGVLDGVR